MFNQMIFLMNQNLIRIFISTIFMVGIISISACSNNISSSSDLRFPEEGGEEVSFSKHVKPFMQVTCATASCHDDYTIAGGRRMTEYYTYFESANIGLVIRGNPDASLLNQMLEGKNKHLYNFNRKLPTNNQQEGMRRWVLNGAPNN